MTVNDMKTSKGILISFEGMEGAGKTTQCKVVSEKLEKLGYKTLIVREPGGVDISEQIREVVLTPRNDKMAVMTEVLLFQAARAQLYAELVLPSLKKGVVVLMDRTRDSSTVYQGVVRGIGVEKIENLNDISTQNTVPHLTFLLDLPAEMGMDRRRRAGNMDRIELEGVPFQAKVCQAYLDIAQKDTSKRWRVIDASQNLESVTAQVWTEVAARLNLPASS